MSGLGCRWSIGCISFSISILTGRGLIFLTIGLGGAVGGVFTGGAGVVLAVAGAFTFCA